MSDPNDVFGPVTPEPAAPDDEYGPLTAGQERHIALDAFGPCVVLGRPSDYNEVTAEAVVLALMDGYTLERINADPELPSRATIMRWAARYPEFAQNYRNAIEFRTHVRLDEIIDIVDNSTGDYALQDSGGEDSTPVMAFQKHNVVRAKLQMDGRLQVIARENPKRYAINQPRPPDAPASDAPRNPEDAKDITPVTRLIDIHPMTEQLAALKQPMPKPET